VKGDLITDTAAIRRIKPRTCVAALDTQAASYLGLIPREHNSVGTQRLGSITKEGNGFMRLF
jgi:transposase